MRVRFFPAALAVLLLASSLMAPVPAWTASLEDALFYGADALYRGKYARAERGFSSALEIDPQNAFALTGLGDAIAMLGRDKEAQEAYDRALSLSPGNLLALRGLGLLALSRNDVPKAASYFNGMLEHDPGNPKALTLLALGEILSGRAPEAVALLARAAPRASSWDHRLAGQLYAALRMPQNARLSLERSLEDDATNLDTLEDLGALYQRQDELDLAQSAFRQALALDPNRPLARAALARLASDQALAAEQAGQSGKAAYLWSAVLEYDRDNVQALAALAALNARKSPGTAPGTPEPEGPSFSPKPAPGAAPSQ